MNTRAIQTFGLVTLITGLIWLLAESQTLRIETVRLSVRVQSGLDGYAVRVDPESRWTGEVEVDVEGPAGAIGSLRELARTPAGLDLGRELQAEVGIYEVDLRQALAQDELFRASGRTVRSVSPEVVRIEVDEVVETTLGVLIDPGAVAPAGTPLAEPSTVVVRAPAAVSAMLPDRATARLPGEDAERLEPGATATVPAVPVTLPDLSALAWGVTIDPPAVAVTITPRRRTISVVLDTVRVSVLASPPVLERWSFALADGNETTRARLTGPVAAVERIRNGDREITAVVRLSAAGLSAGEIRLIPEFIDLPPGVTAEPEGGPVTLAIQPRGPERTGGKGAEPDRTDDSGEAPTAAAEPSEAGVAADSGAVAEPQ